MIEIDIQFLRAVLISLLVAVFVAVFVWMMWGLVRERRTPKDDED